MGAQCNRFNTTLPVICMNYVPRAAIIDEEPESCLSFARHLLHEEKPELIALYQIQL